MPVDKCPMPPVQAGGISFLARKIAMPKMKNGHVTETAVKARADFLDRPVVSVLITSITLVVVAFASIYGGFFGEG